MTPVTTTNQKHFKQRQPKPRPKILEGKTFCYQTGCGKIYITINSENSDPKQLFEIFAQLGHSGSCTKAFTEALSRVVSLALRMGINPEEIIKELSQLKCPSPYIVDKEHTVYSCPDAIAKAIEEYLRK